MVGTKTTKKPTKLYSRFEGDIFYGDALEFLNGIKDASADIVFLDPPFNLGKRYGRRSGKADLLRQHDYITFMEAVLRRSAVILKDGGALYLYHTPQWAYRFANVLEEALTFRHWIAISMKNGFVRGTSLYPAHYALLYFTRGKAAHFHRPKIEPSRCKHCKEFTKDYGGYKEFVKDGINLSDFWDDLSPVRHKKFKHRKSNELPLELPRRVVKVSGSRRGLLVDPFAGAGTSIIAAVEVGMRFKACDSVKSYCSLMQRRLQKWQSERSNGNAES